MKTWFKRLLCILVGHNIDRLFLRPGGVLIGHCARCDRDVAVGTYSIDAAKEAETY